MSNMTTAATKCAQLTCAKKRKRRRTHKWVYELPTVRRFTGTMAFDPGQSGLGLAVVSYVGDLHDYNDPASYVIRHFDVLDVGVNGASVTNILDTMHGLLTSPALRQYTADTQLVKTIECQEGFTFSKTMRLRFMHQMTRMGAIAGMLAGMSRAMGNHVRFMSKCEKWRQCIGVTGFSGRGLPDKKTRVRFVDWLLRKQRNQRLVKQLSRLGHEMRAKAMEDASDAVLMAMENTRKMAAATVGEWPPTNSGPGVYT